MRKSFKAMTHDLPGVTRDRHYSIAGLFDKRGENKRDVILVDTGGFYPEKVEPDTDKNKKKPGEPFFDLMADHAKLAIAESDLVVMVVDVREGLIPFDKTICEYIRTTKKPFILVVNKFDSDKQWGDEAEFYSLGVNEDQFFVVSAEHDRGLETLRERLYDFTESFQPDFDLDIQKGVTPNHDVAASVAIIGAPNAGKSTLLNQFIGAQRALVSNVAGTTVDPIEGYCDLYFGSDAEKLSAMDDQFRKSDKKLVEELLDFTEELSGEEILAYDELPSEFKNTNEDDFEDVDEIIVDEVSEDELFSVDDSLNQLNDEAEQLADADEAEEDSTPYNPFRSIKMVDTAGIRRKNTVDGFIEEQSVYRSLRAISEADVVVFMVDVTKGITHQDRRLCDITLEKGKSLIICLNKVDLIPEIMNDARKKREWLLDLRATIPWLAYCELITISAQKGRYLKALKDSLRKTIVIRNQKVTTGKLNKTVSFLIDKFPIVLDKARGTRFKVKYASMLKSTPPTFLLFTNKSKGIPTNYKKYLKNGLRKEFQMVNTPVHLIFRTTTDIERRMKRVKE
jgi:GTP-binding protein